MKIGVIGAGNIGGTIGDKWAQAGHDVVFGVREPDSSSREGARVAHSLDAIAHGDVVVFAVPGAAVQSIVEENAEALSGKIIIDASNNMRGEARHSLHLLREAAPTAKLYRAFNTLGWENLADPAFEGVKADLFFCGDEEDRSVIEALISDVGLRPISLGGVDQVDLVEGMTTLWFTLALKQKMGRRIAFKVLGV